MNSNKNFYQQALVGVTNRIEELKVLVETKPAAGNYYINQLAKAQTAKAKYEAKLAS